jgi:iron complex transport system ATP-binding protein
MATLTIKDISFRFGAGKPLIVDKVSAVFEGGEITTVIGRNGGGKTTLLKSIARLLKAAGKVSLVDDDGLRLDKSAIAYVPQLSQVNSRLTVFEMVLLGLVTDLKWRVSKEQTERVEEVLAELSLKELGPYPVSGLSGGQKQLVFLAQAFVSKPKALLLDEPTSALDLRHQLLVMNLIRDYTLKNRSATIVVAHDLTLAARYSDKLLMLHEGRIKAFEASETVLRPELLAEVYKVEASVERTRADFLTVVPLEPL